MGCMAEHHVYKVSMGETGENSQVGRGRTQGGGNNYRAVVQEILLYGSETWIILVAMEKKVEGEHTRYLRHITGKQVRQIVDKTWETTVEEVAREAAGMQSVMNYIVRPQATVEQWVALRPIFEVCEGDKGYEGGEHRMEAWWSQ